MSRILVCGGRDYTNRNRVFSVLDSAVIKLGLDVVIHGACRNADLIAEEWAKWREIAYIGCPAKWKTGGNGAGPARNQRMLDEFKPMIVIAFPGGTGTADMVSRAEKAGLVV